MVQIRTARPEAAEEMLEIYKPYILNTAYTFETEIPSVHEFSQRIKKYTEKYPWIVAIAGDQIAGYAYASGHRDRDAYQWTCECSVYVHENFKGKGTGSKLYATLFEILKYQGFRNVYAGITIPNEASEKMHSKCGFELFAVYENIGYKNGAWHKVGWWKLQLNGYDLLPPPPKRFSEIDEVLIYEFLKG
jgi:L-amino acid N-acyltransferase YncA